MLVFINYWIQKCTIKHWKKDFFLHHHMQTDSEAYPCSHQMGLFLQVKCGQRVKLISHAPLVLGWRMSLSLYGLLQNRDRVNYLNMKPPLNPFCLQLWPITPSSFLLCWPLTSSALLIFCIINHKYHQDNTLFFSHPAPEDNGLAPI